MKVELLTATADCFLDVIYAAAKTCQSGLDPIEIYEDHANNGNSERATRLVDHVIKKGHLSVLEHCSMTFAISGISRACLGQLTRHRIGISFSVQSQRHTRNMEIIVPPRIKNDPEALGKYVNSVRNLVVAYEDLINLGIGKEDARFVLPMGAATNLVLTLNLRSLFDLYQKRVVEPGAQWEIKELVTAMVEDIVELEPWLNKYFGGNE